MDFSKIEDLVTKTKVTQFKVDKRELFVVVEDSSKKSKILVVDKDNLLVKNVLSFVTADLFRLSWDGNVDCLEVSETYLVAIIPITKEYNELLYPRYYEDYLRIIGKRQLLRHCVSNTSFHLAYIWDRLNGYNQLQLDLP